MTKRTLKQYWEIGFGIFASATLVSLLTLGATIVKRHYQMSENVEKIGPYLTQNKAAIETEVEQDFGITFDGVELIIVDAFDKRTDFSTAMKYDWGADTITAAKDRAPPHLERPDGWYIPAMTFRTAKGHYIHELGHDYKKQCKDQLREEGKLDPSYTFEKMDTMGHVTRHKILSEGISEYFAVATGEDRPINLTHRMPKTPKDLDNILTRDTYEVGRRIVTPILDKLGVEKGIRTMLSNPIITEEETLNPRLYHLRILTVASH